MTISSYADLLTAQAVRSQSARVTDFVRSGGGVFAVDDEMLPRCAELVVATTKANYPDLTIPYHSRWRHFAAPGATLDTQLDNHLATLDPVEAARVGFDLVIPSVLLDAGAGPDWTFLPEGTASPIGRSEGLGLASLAMFLSGAFAADESPRTDAATLSSLRADVLHEGFGVSKDNPLVGLDGRLSVLRSLGEAMQQRPDVFPNGRLGDLADFLFSSGGPVEASFILETLLDVLSPIWPERLKRDGLQLGDAWIYEPFSEGTDDLAAIVPFHKLSQWMTYSLVETLQRNEMAVVGIDQLTGLPEYRNGGLLLESGVLRLHDPSLAAQTHAPGSQLIVEWRALTITLLDEVAAHVRTLLGRPEMPLAEILEGGTWATGRALAFERDRAGTPPLKLESDGTVF